jgi:hypothetical protein
LCLLGQDLALHVADRSKSSGLCPSRPIGSLPETPATNRSDLEEDYLHPSVRASPAWGPDPRREQRDHLTDFRLYRQLRCYAKEDPPPSRSKPLPLAILHNVRQMAALHNDEISLACVRLELHGILWLLRPGEYCSSVSHRFVSVTYSSSLAELALIHSLVTSLTSTVLPSSLSTFTTQKNGVRGEISPCPLSHL